MPVGNDVVDLQDPANQPSAIHPRFDERVFSDEELERLEALDALAGHRLRWTLWAAREAAFKCLAQREPGIPFRPGEMEVRLDGQPGEQTAGRAGWRGREVEIRVDCGADRVHVVAIEGGGATPVSALRRIARSAGADPHAMSAAAHVLAARTVARALDLDPADVRITSPRRTSTGGAAPGAFHDGAPLPIDVSISHDGGWIACAVLSPPRASDAAR